MNAAGQVSPAPQMPIIGALNALDNSCSHLRDCIDELEKRLDAVLRPPLPAAPAPTSIGMLLHEQHPSNAQAASTGVRQRDGHGQSRVTQEVMSAASRIEDVMNRLAGLSSRLEV